METKAQHQPRKLRAISHKGREIAKVEQYISLRTANGALPIYERF